MVLLRKAKVPPLNGSAPVDLPNEDLDGVIQDIRQSSDSLMTLSFEDWKPVSYLLEAGGINVLLGIFNVSPRER